MPALTLAFFSKSFIATLLTTIDCMQNKLKAPKTVGAATGNAGVLMGCYCSRCYIMVTLAYKYNNMGKSVMLVTYDTSRAAASEQLNMWTGRSDCFTVT
ncbi:unnamed protein product [Brugia pahangi]|uniref:SRP54 domain-containing protein n=1 Tax=Brugia pahangi TaxID=6280 RepID=A0A0N4TW67_BRUPA|nr:unnamed protein product [Brugia pahangi]